MAKANPLLTKAKTIVPPRPKQWWQKHGAETEALLTGFFDAYAAKELAGNFDSHTAAAEFLRDELKLRESVKLISTTLAQWGKPNGPS